MRKFFFLIWYLFFKPPWDTGIAPPILEALVSDESLKPGRALDLGCGRGTNTLFLAKHGWKVQGIDFAPPAIRAARRKKSSAPADVAARVQFRTGDVSKLEVRVEPFDLAFDQGCLHSLPTDLRAGYASGLKGNLRSGGRYLLWAFKPESSPPPSMAEADIRALFEPELELLSVEPSTSGRAAAWYTFRRT